MKFKEIGKYIFLKFISKIPFLNKSKVDNNNYKEFNKNLTDNNLLDSSEVSSMEEGVIKNLHSTIEIEPKDNLMDINYNKIDSLIAIQDLESLELIMNEDKRLRPYFNSVHNIIIYKDEERYWNRWYKDIPKTLNELYATFQFTEAGKVYLNMDDYIRQFKNYINPQSFFNSEKVKILKKMYEDSHFIFLALKPIERLGIVYTMDLTGGCVRDFVLNKHNDIKDLDIMISFNESSLEKFNKLTSEMLINFKLFDEKELISVKWSDDDSVDIKRINLLKLCIEKTNELSEFYSIKNKMDKIQDNSVNYPNELIKPERLMAVAKTKGFKTNYPIDLLLTNFEKYDFLNDFDFNICKASICIKNQYMKLDFPEHFSLLLARFNATHDFWLDVNNKTVTYNTQKRDIKHMLNSFGDPQKGKDNVENSHLNRILKKYPDYSICIADPESENYKSAKSLLDSIDLNKKLVYQETDLSINTRNNVRKKNKI